MLPNSCACALAGHLRSVVEIRSSRRTESTISFYDTMVIMNTEYMVTKKGRPRSGNPISVDDITIFGLESAIAAC